jgi:hypothetical protein
MNDDESGLDETMRGTTAPTAPQNLKAAAVSDTQINLTWDASTDDESGIQYKIYKCTEFASTAATAYNITGLTPLTNYTYLVKAIDADNNLSDPSNAASATTLAAGPAVYYVAPTGSDNNSGSAANPFKTVQKGIDVLQPGDTLNIKEGIYSEKVVIRNSGTAGNYITIQNNGSEHAVLDCSSISNEAPCIAINSKSYLRIEGLEIRNCKAAKAKGIYVDGSGIGIEILGNKIHDLVSSSGGNAIQIQGTDGANPITGVLIDGNELYSNVLGTGENCTVNGNVTRFQITNNIIHDNDNSGIDVAGYYGVASSDDQARNGLVSGNTVYNISAKSNPAYDGVLSADGIYVDGGKDVILERNLVYACDIGVEAGNEHTDKYTTNIIVRNNIIHSSNTYGLCIGGSTDTSGYCTGSYFYNNTLYNNRTGVKVQKSNSNWVFNNIIYDDGVMLAVANGTATMQNNIWYRTAGNNQGLAVFADPGFVDAGSHDFNLRAGSPAINAGVVSINSQSVTGNFGIDYGNGTVDFYEKPRIVNNGIDCGAIESAVVPTGNVYYVSSSTGSDLNNGLSPSTPFKTVAKVNGLPLKAGDTVRFKCGDVWRREYLSARSGNATYNITYTSYGTGSKPLLLGSISKSAVSDWKAVGTNLWECSVPSGLDAGNIILDNSKCAHRVDSSSSLSNRYPDSANGNWWYDVSNNRIRMYIGGNPASLYSSVEIAAGAHLVTLNSRSYITFDGIQLRYGGRHGFSIESCDHITLRNLDLAFIGGTYQKSGSTLRYGNGIEFWANNHDHLVENCSIQECFDAGVTNQSSVSCTQYNITYTNNRIANCEYSYETWITNSSSSMNNIQFTNNNCSGAGYGYSHQQRPDPTGIHLGVGNTSAANSNIKVMNNIFYKAAQTLIWKPSGLNSIALNYNVYSQSSGGYLARYDRNWYTINQSSSYKSSTRQDANSAFNIL